MKSFDPETTLKRLLAAGQFGVRVECQDGHRWLTFSEGSNDALALDVAFKLKGRNINTKVYGTLIDALNLIDLMLEQMGRDSLLDYFDKCGGWEFWALALRPNYESREYQTKRLSTFPIEGKVQCGTCFGDGTKEDICPECDGEGMVKASDA